MILNLYDTDPAAPLAGRATDLDFDYQAEVWLAELRAEPHTIVPGSWVVRAELLDDEGVRATWERPDGDAGRFKLTSAAPRFDGARGDLPGPAGGAA